MPPHVFSRRTGFNNNLLPHGQRGGLTSHRRTLSAHRRPTTTFCAPHACRPLWRDRVNTLRAATRSCTRRRITRQPTPARETRMRIVKPCRPSAATDPHLGAPRAITGDERREERRQVRIMDPAKVICALSSVAWDNRLTATATVLECRNRSMPRDQRIQIILPGPGRTENKRSPGPRCGRQLEPA